MPGIKDDGSAFNSIDSLLKYIEEKILPRLPDAFGSKLKTEIDMLWEVFMKARPPRFVIVGRRGSGKSSLINAIFGSRVAETGPVKSKTGIGKWYDYSDEKGKMSILDTRGFGEGSLPDEIVEKESAEKEIQSSIINQCPDALLFLCKAKEIDSRIDEDLKVLNELIDFIKKRHKYNSPLVCVITQVDELDPPDIVVPPYSDDEKQKNIASAKLLLSGKMQNFTGESVEIIPTSAYMRFEDGKAVYDRRWNIDRLVVYLVEKLPYSARMELARLSRIKSAQKKIARIIIGSSATIAGGIGAGPIPIADLPLITGIQVGMIIGIGYISGREMNRKTAVEFLSTLGLNVGVAFAFREIARALVKLIPAAGSVVSGGVASATTWSIGEAAIAYFIDKKSRDEAKKIFEDESRKREKE